MSEGTAVFIGPKPVMDCVFVCMTLLQSGVGQVTVKARDHAISRAVDAMKIMRKRSMLETKVGPIAIGTEQFPGTESRAQATSAPWN